MGFVLLFNAHCVTHTDAHTHKKSTAEGLSPVDRERIHQRISPETRENRPNISTLLQVIFYIVFVVIH
uniref:Uncharacterized protein n=1 Tax=Gasterosteus aculeatus aculeatus TaxID=481459 RepID=A0AAQ4RXH6_GASAC